METEPAPRAPDKEWVLWNTDEEERDALARALAIDPRLAHLLIRRGYADPDRARTFLDPQIEDMRDPNEFKGMEGAVRVLIESLEAGDRIAVHGDYDVDGISSCSVLYEFLRDLGANVTYFIPRRHVEGYGLTIETVRRLQSEGISTLITTDCGISNVDEIALARALGMRTIIVDHHTVPETLPPADAILNPLQPGCPSGFKQLAAVGVVFYFVAGLRDALRARGLFRFVPEPDLRRYLDLVALGTVADVVPLIEDNRLFVRHGLEVLARRRRAGVSALLERIGAQKTAAGGTGLISYQIAPRLNAAGRMGDAGICVELLTTRSYARAVEVARQLDELNKARQLSERDILAEAMAQAALLVEQDVPIVVVYGDEWNRGVLGIVASRLVERFGRPAVVLGGQGGEARGSARGGRGVNLVEAFGACADLLRSFGGHVAAAGLALDVENVAPFRARLVEEVHRQLALNRPSPSTLAIDARIPLSELDDELLRDIRRLAPFGAGNPEPIFVSGPLAASRARVVGKQHLRARFHEGEVTVDAIGFGLGAARELLERDVEVAYVPRISVRRGGEALDLHLRDLRASDGRAVRAELVEPSSVVEDEEEERGALAPRRAEAAPLTTP